MIRTRTIPVLFLALRVSPLWSQDFQKSYSLQDNARISISTASGDIKVTGYNGGGIQVAAYREGPDANLVQIIDESGSNGISLRTQYPRTDHGIRASVRFEIQVPLGHRYSFDALKTASGDVEMTAAAGDVHVKTASGDIHLKQVSGEMDVNTASGDVIIEGATGTANAHTASGDIEVNLEQIDGNGSMAFSSASGNVTIRVPARISANVQMSTASGKVQSEFPLSVDEHGKKAWGVLGAGAIPLKISTASGDVKLTRN